MLNNKTGVSVSWNYRSNRKNFLTLEDSANFIEQTFKKQEILISEIHIKEFPNLIHFYFYAFPSKQADYGLLKHLLRMLEQILKFLSFKNVIIGCNILPHACNSANTLGNILKIEIFNDPLNIKKLLKKTLSNYASVIKQSKNYR